MIYEPHHTAISVSTLNVSIAFYEALGFVKTNHYREDDGSMHIVQMQLQNMGLELFWFESSANKPNHTFEYANDLSEIGVKHIGLRTKNIDDALEDIKQKGFADEKTEIKTAHSLKDSKYFFIQDPDGMWVEFMEDNTGN